MKFFVLPDPFSPFVTVQEPQREYGPLRYATGEPATPETDCGALAPVLQPLHGRHAGPAGVGCSAQALQRFRELDTLHANDARMLALLAQTDPVFLARVLCLANADTAPPMRRTFDTAHEALRLLGPAVAIDAMRAIAATPAPHDPARSDLYTALLDRAVCIGLTARRLAQYLGLDAADATMLYIAGLLDGFGLAAGLALDAPAAEALAATLAAPRPHGLYGLRDDPALTGYWQCSAAVATAWSAPERVVLALTRPDHEAGRLLAACEAFVAAKREGRSQRAVLHAALPPQRIPEAVDPAIDIDVAFIAAT